MLEETYNYDFLYPGDSVRCIDGGEGYVDYLFSRVLACYGCVIRNLRLREIDADVLVADVIVYKCIEGKRVNGYQFGLQPVRDLELDNYLRHYLLHFSHARDLIVRYPIKGDGSLGYPMWHTIISGMSSYKDWRFTLLPDPDTQLSSVLKDYSCTRSADADDTTIGRMIDVIAVLRHNGFDATPQENKVVFHAFEHKYTIHIHDDVLTLEGLFHCTPGEPVDLKKLSSASNKVWIGGYDFDYGADLFNFPVRLFYEFQDNEKDLYSLKRVIPQMVVNINNAFNHMMVIYKELSKDE